MTKPKNNKKRQKAVIGRDHDPGIDEYETESDDQTRSHEYKRDLFVKEFNKPENKKYKTKLAMERKY